MAISAIQTTAEDVAPLVSVIATIAKTNAVEATASAGVSPTEPTVPSVVVVTANDLTLTASAVSSGYVIAGQTIVPGSDAVTVSGTTISVPSSGNNIVVNQATHTYGTVRSAEASNVILLGSEPIAYTPLTGANGGIVVAGQTVAVGSTITISGHTIALPAASSVVVDATTSPLLLPSAAQATSLLTAGSDTLPYSVASGTSGIVVAGQTLAPGSTITAAGHTIALLPSGSSIVIDGTTAALPVQTTPSASSGILTIGSETLSYLNLPSSGGIVIAGQTLTPGSTIIASGHTIALLTTGSNIIIDGTSTSLPRQSPSPTSPSILTIDSETLSYSSLPSSAGLVIEGQTLTPGATITVSDHTITLPSATPQDLVIDGTTTTLQTSPAQSTGTITLGMQTLPFSLLPSSTEVVIAGQTLTAGATITISGHTISLLTGTSPSELIIDGTTTFLPASPAQAAGLLTLGDQTLAYSSLPGDATSPDGIVIASQTLYPGSVITVNGETLSLLATTVAGESAVETEIVILGGSSAAEEALGAVIMNGIMGGVSAAASASASATGTAAVVAGAAETKAGALSSGSGSGISVVQTETRTSIGVSSRIGAGTGTSVSVASGAETTTSSAKSAAAEGPRSCVQVWPVISGFLLALHMIG